MARKSKLLWPTNDWTFDRLKTADQAIAEIALSELRVDVFPNQIEIIGSDQMLDAYSSHGLPVMYGHWSFGKRFIRDAYGYRKGLSGLAYEIVINSNPCISYLMEENSMTMQALVIAHACYGHNHFFKNNYLFNQWTDPAGIVDYLIFARSYIRSMEEKHGPERVEKLLDACHALMNHGVDRYKRPPKLNKKVEIERQKQRVEEVQKQANILWSTLPKQTETKLVDDDDDLPFPREPQENILYFLEKNSPVLKDWEREIVRIVRQVSQYFYPQMQTKLMNEGFATFTHYYVMYRLWEKGQIDDGTMMEAIHSHTSVVAQRSMSHPHYSGFNPYALGFAMFNEIKRICEKPTKEDEEFFPHLVGTPWLDAVLDAVVNYRDESFVNQFLSPKLARDWRLAEILDKQKSWYYTISSIQNDRGFNNIRGSLAAMYSYNRWHPNIQIVDANIRGDRTLELVHFNPDGSTLQDEHNQLQDTLGYIRQLWGYTVRIDDNRDEARRVRMED